MNHNRLFCIFLLSVLLVCDLQALVASDYQSSKDPSSGLGLFGVACAVVYCKLYFFKSTTPAVVSRLNIDSNSEKLKYAIKVKDAETALELIQKVNHSVELIGENKDLNYFTDTAFSQALASEQYDIANSIASRLAKLKQYGCLKACIFPGNILPKEMNEEILNPNPTKLLCFALEHAQDNSFATKRAKFYVNQAKEYAFTDDEKRQIYDKVRSLENPSIYSYVQSVISPAVSARKKDFR